MLEVVPQELVQGAKAEHYPLESLAGECVGGSRSPLADGVGRHRHGRRRVRRRNFGCGVLRVLGRRGEHGLPSHKSGKHVS